MANAYLFFGKAGSGKGTQAAELKKYLESNGKKVIYIETGGFFRELTKTDSFTGKRVQEAIDQGILVPPFFPVYAWTASLMNEFTGIEEVIMDGVARHIDEARLLDGALEFFQFEQKFILAVELADESAMNRLLIRGQDRADDSSRENIQKRLNWYQERVVPVLHYFKENKNYQFKEINGEVSVEEVFEQIKKTIK